MNKNNTQNQLLLFQQGESRLEVLNFSVISIFQRCPLEYKYRFSPRNPHFDPRGNEILLGRILHSITSDYLLKPPNERNERLNIQENWKKFSKYFNSNNQRYYEIIIKAVDHLMKGPLSRLVVHALEYPFKTPFRHLLLVGRVDCLGRETIGDMIVDFKLDPSELEYHSTQIHRFLQLIFYYFGIKNFIPLNSPYLAYYFFTNGSLELVKVSEDLVCSGIDEIQRLNHERKKMKAFHPRKSYHCLTCAVGNKDLCPLSKNK